MGDLWAPDKDANTYGARKKKKLRIGQKVSVPDIPLRKRNMIGKVSKGNPLPARILKRIPTSSATRKSRSLVVSRSNKNLTATVPNNNDCISSSTIVRV